MTSTPEDSNANPFTAETAPGVALIVQMRIYDLLAAIYTEMTADENGHSVKATKLLEAHDRGLIVGPLPYLNLPAEPADKL